jgi:hypothetical protein
VALMLLNGGKDKLFDQHLGTAAQPAAFNYLSLTANTTTPVATDTTMTGEITTGGAGLTPAQGAYAHTSSTNNATLTKQFTTNGTDSLPVVIGQVGIRNASAGGGTVVHGDRAAPGVGGVEAGGTGDDVPARPGCEGDRHRRSHDRGDRGQLDDHPTLGDDERRRDVGRVARRSPRRFRW